MFESVAHAFCWLETKNRQTPKINQFKTTLRTASLAALCLLIMPEKYHNTTPLSVSTNKPVFLHKHCSLKLLWPEMTSTALPVLFPHHQCFPLRVVPLWFICSSSSRAFFSGSQSRLPVHDKSLQRNFHHRFNLSHESADQLFIGPTHLFER